MKIALLACLSILPVYASADVFTSKIHSFDEEFNFIRLENGRIAFLNKNKTNLDLATGSTVTVDVDANNELQSLKVLEAAKTYDITLKSMLNVEPPIFEPTVLSSPAAAQEMFDRLNTNFKRLSECSDRAHVWAYDEFKSNGFKSQKIFAFFTASYINRNRFKWWFHVAPLVHVQEGGQVQMRVLDYMYMDRPVLIKEWTDLMVFSKRECKMTAKFSEYDVNPQTEDCYMMIDSMYNRLPGDLHAQELKGIYRESFNDSEVNFSRRAGFFSDVRSGNAN